MKITGKNQKEALHAASSTKAEKTLEDSRMMMSYGMDV
jgi:hypothetical protein